MSKNLSSHDLSSCLLLFNPETEIDFLELKLFETICDQLKFTGSLEMIYSYFLRICLVLMENSTRRILFQEFKKYRYDYISESSDEKDIVTSSFNSLTAESSGQLKYSLCTPFQYTVSFSDIPIFYDYSRDHEFSAINVLTIELSKRKSRDSLYLFGKDTTAFYRWDHNPSYQLITDFLLEKK